MLIAQGFDGIFKGIGDALDAFAAAFAFLLFLAAVAMLVAALAGAASILWLAVHAVTTMVRLAKKKYREKGPGLLSVLMSLPGIVIPATALVVMLNDGPGSNDGIPLIVFLFSTGALLFVWFAPWAQHVSAISQDGNVTAGQALGQVIYQNRGRFLLTIGVPLLLVSWVTAAVLFQVP